MTHRIVKCLSCIIFSPLLVIFSCIDNGSGHSEKSGGIISLSPSVTRQIVDLEAEELLAGVTDYHPDLKKSVPVVGTYINPSIETIIRLKPGIILMSEEDADVQREPVFRRFGMKYHMFRRNRTFDDICENYSELGRMIGRGELAGRKLQFYRERLNGIRTERRECRVVFLVSVRPLITVSGDTHISGIINDAGGINPFAGLKSPYPLLTLESLLVCNPDIVIVMNRGDENYLYSALSGFRGADFITGRNIFVAGDEEIPYYTPREYVRSVEKIALILEHAHK